ncbi:MAG TPA: fasciclin domain-containing protein, partial [Chitinophagaceae bacterium]|nr:fasciclin domain-containing protein [Chitinophagaceae bacterium]
MNKSFKIFLAFLCLAFFILGCRKKDFADFYERPEGLEPPIYQSLEKKGKFTNLLSLIDKAGYKQTLSTAGFWTMFAPTDSAFNVYFTQNNLSLSGIDSVKAQEIVKYLLVYNAFDKEKIDDYQSTLLGWVPDIAFKRRTTYYNGFFSNTAKDSMFVNANRNGSYTSADNNNKHIPYFTDVFLTNKGLTAADYNFFYPNSTFNGFNVADAKVVEKDFSTENGMIHVIDKVVTPLLSIDEYLEGKPQYSEFRNLLKKYIVSYALNADASQRYKLLTGNNKDVYVKLYNGIGYSLNNENFTKLQDNDAQQDGWTIFVPTNEALSTYVNNVVLEYYKSFDNAPRQLVIDFINSHLFRNTVWPSKFLSSSNILSEPARFTPQTDIIDRKILSNGFFYGTNKVQESNIFSTVYSRAYLDPKFSYTTRLINTDGTLKFSLLDPGTKYTVFMMPDAVITAAGYT